LNIYLENVNLNSQTGPNSFGQKLVKYICNEDIMITGAEHSDVSLCFIESRQSNIVKPLVQRLDGIYFDVKQDYVQKNSNIQRTYNLANAVIFQSEFAKQLVTTWFGDHNNTVVIHNGADFDKIETISPIKNKTLDKYENVWSCASHWRPHKRLAENVRYFLEHSSEKDCLVVAGNAPEKVEHDRIFYTGNLPHNALVSLYKRSRYFIHLAKLDNCPNVVVDARACGSQIICTDSGGTREIAGPDAIVIPEEEWDFKPLDLYNPPKLDFSVKKKNDIDTNINMQYVAEQYLNVLTQSLECR